MDSIRFTSVDPNVDFSEIQVHDIKSLKNQEIIILQKITSILTAIIFSYPSLPNPVLSAFHSMPPFPS
jgi:hypothetical protein